jgi:hypothetical protein
MMNKVSGFSLNNVWIKCDRPQDLLQYLLPSKRIIIIIIIITTTTDAAANFWLVISYSCEKTQI